MPPRSVCPKCGDETQYMVGQWKYREIQVRPLIFNRSYTEWIEFVRRNNKPFTKTLNQAREEVGMDRIPDYQSRVCLLPDGAGACPVYTTAMDREKELSTGYRALLDQVKNTWLDHGHEWDTEFVRVHELTLEGEK